MSILELTVSAVGDSITYMSIRKTNYKGKWTKDLRKHSIGKGYSNNKVNSNSSNREKKVFYITSNKKYPN